MAVTQENCGGLAASARISAVFRKRDGYELEVWFEVPRDLQGHLTDSANPWLICMLPHALDTGESIETDLPADRVLCENLRGLVAQWCSWYPELRPVQIDVPVQNVGQCGESGRTAAFFSGGVDSWFTILRHLPDLEPEAVGNVDDLVNVHGFDIPWDRTAEYEAMRAALQADAEAIGRRLVTVRTNLRQPKSLWHRGWGWLTNAAGLVAVALLLEKRYSRVLVGSTHPFGNLIPWGSHPLTDPLLSTSRVEVRHDGASFTRVEKTALVARHAAALAHLHVCWKHGTSSNCGRCSKCLRTMATLSLLGVSPREHSAFPVDFELGNLARMFIGDTNEEGFIAEIRQAAEALGRADFAAAATQAMVRSSSIRRKLRWLSRMRSIPALWRLEQAGSVWLKRGTTGW